jgi:hypothetical protein
MLLAAILFGIIWLALCVVLGKPTRQGGLRSQTAVIFAMLIDLFLFR